MESGSAQVPQTFLAHWDGRDLWTDASEVYDQAMASPSSTISIDVLDLRDCAELCGEVYAVKPDGEINAFRNACRAIPTVYYPLMIGIGSRDYLRPASESVIGEAIAGYLVRSLKNAGTGTCRLIGRSPDILMPLQNSALAIVEAKTTIQSYQLAQNCIALRIISGRCQQYSQGLGI